MKRLILCILLVLAWCGTAWATKTITSCIYELDNDTDFKDYSNDDYDTLPGSALFMQGSSSAAITTDIDGYNYLTPPSIGPYEAIENLGSGGEDGQSFGFDFKFK